MNKLKRFKKSEMLVLLFLLVEFKNQYYMANNI
jgi:hypothetical protein